MLNPAGSPFITAALMRVFIDQAGALSDPGRRRDFHIICDVLTNVSITLSKRQYKRKWHACCSYNLYVNKGRERASNGYLSMRDSEIAGWMWAEACQMIEQAERLQRQFFRVGSPRERTPAWEPPMDVLETDDEVLIYVALPGVSAEHLQVTLEENMLVVAGARLMPEQRQTALIHRLEVPLGRFERRIRLPARSLKLVQSLFDNGLLALTLHKA